MPLQNVLAQFFIINCFTKPFFLVKRYPERKTLKEFDDRFTFLYFYYNFNSTATFGNLVYQQS